MKESESRSPRNPSWTRDELTLALQLYFQLEFAHNAGRYSIRSPEIVELSDTLNKLRNANAVDPRFRNPSGVYMKLNNFRGLDPAYAGKGLDAGSRLDVEIWEKFKDHRPSLVELASAIVRNLPQTSAPAVQADEEYGLAEGNLLLRVHLERERSTILRNQKIQAAQRATGQLACEVCDMTFEQFYGEVGTGFIEVHHRIALAKLEPGTKTRLADLALICSNCHRMAHKGDLAVHELRALLEN